MIELPDFSDEARIERIDRKQTYWQLIGFVYTKGDPAEQGDSHFVSKYILESPLKTIRVNSAIAKGLIPNFWNEVKKLHERKIRR